MNTKDLQKITSFAAQTGLKTDIQSGVVYGNFGGYNVTVSPISGTVMFQISVFVSRGGSKPDINEIENIKMQLCEQTNFNPFKLFIYFFWYEKWNPWNNSIKS